MSIKALLTTTMLAATFAGNAQQFGTYAFTGDGNSDYLWMSIRKVDVKTGLVSQTVFQRSNTPYQLKELGIGAEAKSLAQASYVSAREYPTASMVAAAALDTRSNRLFFTPMRMAELRWLDLNSKDQAEFYTLKSDVLNVGSYQDEANQISRMSIAADGNVYALTNDGNHLFRISTLDATPVITDLGNLVDGEENKDISIHSKCTSWGGDMIADAFGKLYVISANHHVFSVDIETRLAEYKGMITGLPAGYSTNAAAVTGEQTFMVGSANMFTGYYEVDFNSLEATKIEGSEVKYNASDFANGELLFQKRAGMSATLNNAPSLPEMAGAGQTKIFPNPVTNSTFNVIFNGKQAGNYTVVLTDLAGRVLQTNKVSVVKGLQTEKINIRSRQTKGIFMVKVYDENKQSVMTEKILVQ
jgi:hypothetical protein